jgi:hypothetical protein
MICGGLDLTSRSLGPRKPDGVPEGMKKTKGETFATFASSRDNVCSISSEIDFRRLPDDGESC